MKEVRELSLYLPHDPAAGFWCQRFVLIAQIHARVPVCLDLTSKYSRPSLISRIPEPRKSKGENNLGAQIILGAFVNQKSGQSQF